MDDAEQTAIVVLPSSTELFYVYGQTLEGCATLSTGKPLFDLLEVFKKWLRVYAGELPPLSPSRCNLTILVPAEEVLMFQMRRYGVRLIWCRPFDQTTSRTQPPRRSADVRYDQNEIKNACLVINTAEYCQSTAQEVGICCERCLVGTDSYAARRKGPPAN